MANTNIKSGRAPRVPKTPKAQPEVVTKPESVEIEPEEVTTPVTPEPGVTMPEQPKAPAPEPEQVDPKTTVHLVQKGEKYNVYRGSKKLTRNLVTLEKANLIARGYGESNPSIQ